MASRHSKDQRISRHSEHDDRFESRYSRNNERSSRRFDEFEKNRDITSTLSGIDRRSSKLDQKYSKNDNKLQENLENKIKFQESFGIERRSNRKIDQENLKNNNISGRHSATTESSNVGQFKDLRQLLQSKRRESQDEKPENERKSSISARLGPKIKEEAENNSQFEGRNLRMDGKVERNSSRFGENSTRLVNNFLNIGRKSSKIETSEKITSNNDKESSNSAKIDQTSSNHNEPAQNSSEAPQPRLRKPIRVRNPANRLADLVRLQVVDAVKRNEKREISSSSKSDKSASHESLIEISSSSDDVKVVEVKSPKESSQKCLELAMNRLKADFEEISSSDSENWVNMIDEDEFEESNKNNKKSEQKYQEIKSNSWRSTALKQENDKISNQTQFNHVQIKKSNKPDQRNLHRSSSMSSLAENKPQIQRHQIQNESQRHYHQRRQFESRQSSRFQRNQSNKLQRTQSNNFQNQPQQGRMYRTNSGHFEPPQSIENSTQFKQFRFESTQFEQPANYHPNQPRNFNQMPQNQCNSNQHQNIQLSQIERANFPRKFDSSNWNEFQHINTQFIGSITSNSYQNQDSAAKSHQVPEIPQQIPVFISNYHQDQHLTSNYQEIPHITSNTQNIPPLIPNLHNFQAPISYPSRFQPQNQTIPSLLDSNFHQSNTNLQEESTRVQQRTPSPSHSVSSSSSSSATDLFGAPSKLEARLNKIRGNEKKFSDGNKSSSMESLKSNGFNANAKAFYPKQAQDVHYQQQVESTEPVYYDSHHSFNLSAYVDESSDKAEESSNKLTHEQMINLLYVTKTSDKYMNEALSYYVEYYDELGYNLSKNAVDEILMAKGIESKSCDFTFFL